MKNAAIKGVIKTPRVHAIGAREAKSLSSDFFSFELTMKTLPLLPLPSIFGTVYVPVALYTMSR